MKQKPSSLFLAFGVVILVSLAYWAKILPFAPRIFTVALFFGAVVLALLLLRVFVAKVVDAHWQVAFDRLLLMFGALMVAVLVIEIWLHVAGVLQLGRSVGQGMPVEWQKRSVTIDGAKSAFFWHNILHVFDENHMRRTRPFPPRTEGQCRIVVVGDSLTYGYGVSNDETYCSVLERKLARGLSVEVLNLGISGLASEGILDIVQRFVPKIEPDVVVYGICLNDFLPLGVGTYTTPQVDWIPVSLKVFVALRTKVGVLARDSYADLLVALGVRHDFYDDILEDYGSYRSRFGRDLKTMNEFVIGQGLPPVVSVVLDESPRFGGRGYRIAQFAEEGAMAAGMTVVLTENYYREHDEKRMKVSSWEGHPNRRAHVLFAELISPYLESHPALNSCLRPECPEQDGESVILPEPFIEEHELP